MHWNRRDTLYLLLVTLLAAALRFYQLGEAPPGFQFDEAFNAIDAEQVWHGNRPLFLPANGGREALYTYYQAGLGALFGFHVYSLRLASALAGIATIPATYWLLRLLIRRRSRPVALFTSLALTVSFWHLHFSHYGIRVIMMPLLLCGIIGTFWSAMHSEKARTRWIALVAAGLFTGLAPWTHPAGRFVPFILVGYVAWLWASSPARPRPPSPSHASEGEMRKRTRMRTRVGVLRTLFLTGLIAFIVFLPLGIEFYRHPDFFFGHASEVSIFAERVSGESHPWRMLGQNLLLVLGMFNVHGDVEWAHNIPGRPVFEWPLGIAFLVGVLFWFGRLLRRRADDPDINALMLLAAWSAIMLLPSILSEAAPNYSRTLPALPAIFVPVGLALAWLVDLPRKWRSRQTSNRVPSWSGSVVAGLLVLTSGSQAFYDYFVRYPQMPESYYIYDTDKLDALEALEALAAAGNTIYLAPLWSEHATFAFLRDTAIIKSLDSGETVVLPPEGKGAVYAFPAEKAERAEALTKLWPDIGTTIIADRYGKPLLATVQLPAEQAAHWPSRYEPEQQSPDQQSEGELPAYFEDAPTLIGVQQRNNRQELRLFWRAEAPTLRNLTTFLHLIDRDGRRVAQVDKLPGDGSYLTPTWTPGERVIERYDVDFADNCYGEDPLTLVVGWYELAADGARRPRVDALGNPLPDDSANAGTVTFPMIAQPPEAFTLPPAANLLIANDLLLYGFVVNGEAFQANSAFSIDLYWHASDELNKETITLQLRDGEIALPLWQEIVAADVPWHEGELLCRRAHLTLPAEIVPGNYNLELTTSSGSSESTPFHTVVVE